MAEILVIDDEKEMLSACAAILQALGHRAVVMSDGAQAIELLQTHEFDLILCDLFMPEVDGMKVLAASREMTPDTPMIVFSAYGTIERAVAAIKAGAFDFLEKPFEADDLQVVIEKGLRQRDLFRERQNLLAQLDDKYHFDNLIGRDPKMQEIFKLIQTVAATDANVIISGESGTGKELVARSIHSHSKRRAKAFIPVNCGALPENLFESELFGFEKGAFTGALRRKAGLLELANGGTFFLDEVCELTEPLQVKLLRVLQDRQVRRLGGHDLIDLDVHYVAATNRDIDLAVKEGRLREDFYYRLNVVHIQIPSLRERREDIRPLAEHLLIQLSKTHPNEVSGFSEEVLTRFENYDWPGNVREMENVIERALTMCTGPQITSNDLPPHLLSEVVPETPLTDLSLVEAKQKMIEQLERKYLLKMLEKYRGNVTHIAEVSGMTRRNLHRLLNRYGFSADSWRKN